MAVKRHPISRWLLAWAGTFLGAGAMIFLSASPGGAHMWEVTDQKTVDVALLIHGPDGKIVPDTNLQVSSDYRGFSSNGGPITTKTDDRGIANFKIGEGVFALMVEAENVGYGITAAMEFTSDGVNTPDLPRLVPYGSISGALPKDAQTFGRKIVAYSDGPWHREVPAAIDASGHYVFKNLHSGKYNIQCNSRTGTYEGSATIWPGRNIADFHVTLIKSDPALAGTLNFNPMVNSRDGPATRVSGTVVDEEGKPFANAKICAAITDANFSWNSLANSTADAEGGFVVQIPRHYDFCTCILAATAQGHPPTWDSLPLPGTHDSQIIPPLELVLLSRGASLDVTILQDGKPAAGKSVKASLTGDPRLQPTWQSLPENLSQIASPVAVTGDDGIVHFHDLIPGVYDILSPPSANPDWVQGVRSISFGADDAPKPYACAQGIAVSLDETAVCRVGIWPGANHRKFRVLKPDGSPCQTEIEMLPFGNVDLDDSGFGKIPGFQRGLTSGPMHWTGKPAFANWGSYPGLSAQSALAGSAILDQGFPFTPTFTLTHVSAPALHAEVHDESGKPLRAGVSVTQDEYHYADGYTDEGGTIDFNGIPFEQYEHPSSSWTLQAYSSRYPPFEVGQDDAFPADSELENLYQLFPRVCAIKAGNQTSASVAPQLSGFVRGKILLPELADLAHVQLLARDAERKTYSYGEIRPASGEYLVGPLLPGPVKLSFSKYGSENTPNLQYVATTQIAAGKVVHLDITPATSQVQVGDTFSQKLTGDVFLADGKTTAPANAIVNFYKANNGTYATGITDAHGQIRTLQWAQEIDTDTIFPDQTLTAVNLPGKCGFQITPGEPRPGAPLHLVLPPPISLQGNVSVEGRDASNLNGTVEVLAAYEATPFINHLVNVQTTADPDGHFTLAALTPGKYRVQASLDRIWLSQTVEINVSPEHPLEPISLHIGQPGAGVLLHLKDSAAKPAIRKSITIDRPPGPLAEQFWKVDWKSDGAGLVFIPTLEAGKTVIHAEGLANPVIVQVPPLPADRPVDVNITLDSP